MGTFAMQKRQIVDTTAIPAYVGQSVAAAKDKTFFTNNSGVSVTGMGRAFINNLRGGKTQGGSTLTQQYVERYYVDKTTTDYVGKFKETLLAIKIAKSQSKAEIMDGYLNTIYWGRDSYGIQAAAQAYFGVDAADLTVEQAAMLAGIIPSPNNWDPDVSPAKAEARWNIVLDSMEEQGWVDPAGAGRDGLPADNRLRPERDHARHHGYLLQMVIDELEKPPYSDHAATSSTARATTIVTTISPEMQEMTVDQVNGFMAGTLEGQSGKPDDSVAARVRPSITSVDPKTGAILALYGGPDYLTDAKNRATYDTIQAGLDVQAVHPDHGARAGHPAHDEVQRELAADDPRLGPAPARTPSATSSPATSAPWTWSKATAESVNTVYAQLNMKVGADNTAETATKAGVGRRADHGQLERARRRRRAPAEHGERVRDDRVGRHPRTTRTSSPPSRTPTARSRSSTRSPARRSSPPTSSPTRRTRCSRSCSPAPARTGSSRSTGRSPARPARRPRTSRRGSSASPRTSSPRCRSASSPRTARARTRS